MVNEEVVSLAWNYVVTRSEVSFSYVCCFMVCRNNLLDFFLFVFTAKDVESF